jgi:intracellular protein transport protein USO1
MADKDRAQQQLEAETADLKATITRLESSEGETARVKRRAEADMADLKATISRLEVDLMKVGKFVHSSISSTHELAGK